MSTQTTDPPKKRSALDDDFGAPPIKSALDEDFGSASFPQAQPSSTTPPGAVGGPIGSATLQGALQEPSETLLQPAQLASALDAAAKPAQGPPSKFLGYDAQYPGSAPPPEPPAGMEPPAPTNKKPREFAYGEGGFAQRPDGSMMDARDARIERDFAEHQGVYSTLNLPGASQYSPAREKAMRDAGTWSDFDELRKKQAPLIIQSDLLRRKQDRLNKDVEKYGIAKREELASMLGGDLTYLGEELKKMQASGNADPAAFNEMAAQYNEKLATYNQQAAILKPFIEEQQDIQKGFEYLQAKHAQTEAEFAQSPTQKTKAARQEIADQRFAAAEKDIRQGNYLTRNVIDQYVVSPVSATLTKGVLGAAGALGRGLDAWVNIPNAVTGDESNYSPFAKAADNLFDAAEELAPTPKQASQPLFDKAWNLDTHALLPKAMQAATYMGMLGVAGAARGEPGMMAASYMTTEEDYYKEAISAGLKPGEAQAFSMTSAALTSFLEKVNPGPLLNSKTVKGAMLERAAKALRDGKNWKEAVKDGTQYIIKEGLGEGGQELLQAGGDDLVKGSAKLAIGERADGLEVNTAQAYAENALLGLSMGTLAAVGGKAMDRPLHMQSLDWAVRNRQKVEEYIKKNGGKDATQLLERLDKISRVYAGNNLTSMPPEKSAKVASLVQQKNDLEDKVKNEPMDLVMEAAKGNPAKRRIAEIMDELLVQQGVSKEQVQAAKVKAGIEQAPEGTKLVTNPDGSVTLEKKPEAGTTKKKPTAAATESRAQDSPVSDEAATGFQAAIDASKQSRSPNEVSEWVLSNSQVGDTYTDNIGNGYEVVNVKTRKDGKREMELQQFEILPDGTKEVNNAGVLLLVDGLPNRASNLLGYAYTDKDGNRQTSEYKLTRNEGSTTTTEAPAAQAPTDTGAEAGVPDQPAPARVEPVLTQDVPDDRLSLAAAYEQARMEHGDEGDPDAVLAALTAGNVSMKSYERWGDKNNVFEGMGKQYFRAKGRDLDEIAQEASDITGQEITPEDVAAFMERFPSGRPQRSPRMVELDQRHGALHGTKLNSLVAKSILAKNKGTVPKFTPQEQAIAEEAEQQGVDLTELDDQDSEDYENMTDEEDDIMFGGGSTIAKFDQNATRGTKQPEPGGTPPAQGEVRGDESTGAPDPEADRLAADATRARAERDKFVADWNDRGQGLFAPEEGASQLSIDGGFDNSQGNFDARVEPLNEKVRQADNALADYVNSAASRAQAAAQQTSIDQAPATPANMTEASVINRDYRKLKEELGEKKAKKYFEQVDRLFNPNSTRVVEYRKNGVVTEADGDQTFHALADMDGSKWRVSFSLPHGAESIKRKKAEEEAAKQQVLDKRASDKAERIKTAPVFQRRNGWEIVKDGVHYVLRNPFTKEELNYHQSLPRVREWADEEPPQDEYTTTPAATQVQSDAAVPVASPAVEVRPVQPVTSITEVSRNNDKKPTQVEYKVPGWEDLRLVADKGKSGWTVREAESGMTIDLTEQPTARIAIGEAAAKLNRNGREKVMALLEKGKKGQYEKRADEIARSMEKAKLDPNNLYAIPIPPGVWNGAVSAAQAAVRTGGKFADGVAAAIDHIKNDPWFKSLSKSNQDEAADGVSDLLNMMTPPLDGEAGKMQRIFDKQRDDAKKARGTFWKKAKDKLARGVVDRRALLRETLTQAGAAEAMWRKDLVVGASPAAKRKFTKFNDAIFKGLSPQGEEVLNDWIQARRTIDIDSRRDADGIARPLHPGGSSKEMAEMWLAERTKENPKMAADMERRSTAYFDAQRELLEMKYKEGRITKDLYDRLKDNNYSQRMFLHHVLDAEGVDRPQGGNRVSSHDIKLLDKGSMESLMHNARWLLEANTLSTYRTQFENKANRALYDFVKSNPNNGFAKIQKPDGFNNATGQPIYPDAPTGYRQVQYFENGIRKSMVMKTDMATDWENKDPLLGRQVANALRIATGGAVLRMFATGINPAFALANTPRDIAHVLVTTDLYSPHLPVGFAQINKDIATVMGDVVKRKGRYLEYLEEGGGMDFLSHQGRPLQVKTTGRTRVGESLEAVQHFMGWLGETSELLVRVAIRERALENNLSKFKAANGRDPNAAELKALKENATYQARRQMDFSQGGEWAKAADNFKPYLNATIQGTRTLVRGAKENPKTFSYKIAQLGALATALVLYNLNYDDDDWDDVPDYVKANNFVILLPFQKEDRNGDMRRAYISIPKSQDQVVFAGVFEQLAEFLKTGKYPTKRISNDLKNTFPDLDPREIPIMAALIAYKTNFDTYRESEIWKGKDNLEPWAEYTANTPGLYRSIGEITAGDDQIGGLSPERLKVASSKLLTDQENNVFTQVLAKGYGLAAEGLDVKQRKELDKAMLEHLNDVSEPMYRRWLRFTDPKDDAPDLDRFDRQESTRKKLQDDKVKEFMSRLRKADGDKGKEAAVNKDAQDWVNSEPRAERQALAKKYLDWRGNMDVPFEFIQIKNMETPEAKARAMWELWVPASETERKEMEKNAQKVGGIISERFRAEFGKLKQATKNAKPE